MNIYIAKSQSNSTSSLESSISKKKKSNGRYDSKENRKISYPSRVTPVLPQANKGIIKFVTKEVINPMYYANFNKNEEISYRD
jgi:hypothetical protein